MKVIGESAKACKGVLVPAFKEMKVTGSSVELQIRNRI